MATRQVVDGSHEIESRSANLAAVRLVGAVSDQIDAEFALRRLDRGVALAFGNVKALCVESLK